MEQIMGLLMGHVKDHVTAHWIVNHGIVNHGIVNHVIVNHGIVNHVIGIISSVLCVLCEALHSRGGGGWMKPLRC